MEELSSPHCWWRGKWQGHSGKSFAVVDAVKHASYCMNQCYDLCLDVPAKPHVVGDHLTGICDWFVI